MGGDEEEDPPPKYLGDYPDGFYWSSVPPETDAADIDDYEVSGRIIRFMGDYGVTVPLWDAEGLLPDEPGWLRASLGLSDELIDELKRWGHEMNELDASAGELNTDELRAAHDNLNAQGEALANRLQQELGERYTVVHRRW